MHTYVVNRKSTRMSRSWLRLGSLSDAGQPAYTDKQPVPPNHQRRDPRLPHASKPYFLPCVRSSHPAAPKTLHSRTTSYILVLKHTSKSSASRISPKSTSHHGSAASVSFDLPRSPVPITLQVGYSMPCTRRQTKCACSAASDMFQPRSAYALVVSRI